ncbi:hypothetical protein B2J88_13165 [Rhodococcus sp. SRB_17]|nr:hypothetical protein [Rhodococcus sp. SRB_17]
MTVDGLTRASVHSQCKLMILRCSHCATLLAPTMAECSWCHGSTFVPVESCGVGSIVSSKVVEREVDNLFSKLEPCTIAIVELDDGPWVYSWVTGTVPTTSDGRVRVEYTSTGSAGQLPVFVVSSGPVLQSAPVQQPSQVLQPALAQP